MNNVRKLNADRTLARRLVENISDRTVAVLVERTGRSPKQVLEHLRADAHWRPREVIHALENVR